MAAGATLVKNLGAENTEQHRECQLRIGCPLSEKNCLRSFWMQEAAFVIFFLNFFFSFFILFLLLYDIMIAVQSLG